MTYILQRKDEKLGETKITQILINTKQVLTQTQVSQDGN